MSIKEQEYGIGIVSVSFRDRAPSEIMGEMKRCGLSLVEWGSDIHAPCNDIARLEEISEMQQQFNIRCSSYGTYFRLGVTPIDELVSYINAAKALGTDVLRLWCGNKSGDAYTDSDKRRVRKITARQTQRRMLYYDITYNTALSIQIRYLRHFCVIQTTLLCYSNNTILSI